VELTEFVREETRRIAAEGGGETSEAVIVQVAGPCKG